MALEVIRDRRLIKAIEKSNSELNPHLSILMERFRGYHFQELGGSVRSVLLKEWRGIVSEPSDMDFILDDSEKQIDLFGLCKGLPGLIKRNHHGNVKWMINDYEVDITKYSTEKGKGSEVSLKTFLEGSDFNLGTLAYCPQCQEIYSLNAVEGIKKGIISLMNPDPRRPEAALVRAVNFEIKLGFDMDETTLNYIRKTYAPSMDEAIRKYMGRKRMSEKLYSLVISRLREISPETVADCKDKPEILAVGI